MIYYALGTRVLVREVVTFIRNHRGYVLYVLVELPS